MAGYEHILISGKLSNILFNKIFIFLKSNYLTLSQVNR